VEPIPRVGVGMGVSVGFGVAVYGIGVSVGGNGVELAVAVGAIRDVEHAPSNKANTHNKFVILTVLYFMISSMKTMGEFPQLECDRLWADYVPFTAAFALIKSRPS